MSKRYKVFNKPARSYQELACLLISRGLEATLNDLVNVLQRVSYYRFSGYLVPFRRLHSDAFIEGTKLPLILDRYYFDQELRSLVFNAIDNVEIAIRNTIMHIHVRTYKAAGYRKHCTLPNLSHRDYVDLLRKISYAYSDKKETFMIHYKRKYNDFDRYPLWMAFELLTFGTIVRFYSGMTTELKKQVANYYEVSAEVLFSWLICLNYVRNLCAHHNRLWNRSLADSPKIPRAKPKYDIWHNPIEVTSPESNARIFQALTVIRYLSRKIECNEDFVFNLNALLEKYPSIPLSQMGFPENWLECPIWLE